HDRAAAAACSADAARLAGGADAAVVARGDRERRDAHGRQPGAREARLHLARRAAAVAVGSVAVGDVRRVAVTGAWTAAGNVLEQSSVERFAACLYVAVHLGATGKARRRRGVRGEVPAREQGAREAAALVGERDRASRLY